MRGGVKLARRSLSPVTDNESSAQTAPGEAVPEHASFERTAEANLAVVEHASELAIPEHRSALAVPERAPEPVVEEPAPIEPVAVEPVAPEPALMEEPVL